MPQKRDEVIAKPRKAALAPEEVEQERAEDGKELKLEKGEDAHELAKRRKRGGRNH